MNFRRDPGNRSRVWDGQEGKQDMKAMMTPDRFVCDNWDEPEVKRKPLRAKPWASLRAAPRLTEW